MAERESDSKLKALAEAGDERALKALLTVLYPRLCCYLAGKIPACLRSQLDAEDVAQEAMVAAVRNIAAFKPRGANSFDRWVMTIALRRLRTLIARHRAAKRGGDRVPRTGQAPSVDDSMVAFLDQFVSSEHTGSWCVARSEAVQAVRQALVLLSAAQREAVWRVHIEGQPPGEAAVAMGCTVRAVHNLCTRGRVRLREILRSGSRFLSSK